VSVIIINSKCFQFQSDLILEELKFLKDYLIFKFNYNGNLFFFGFVTFLEGRSNVIRARGALSVMSCHPISMPLVPLQIIPNQNKLK